MHGVALSNAVLYIREKHEEDALSQHETGEVSPRRKGKEAFIGMTTQKMLLVHTRKMYLT